MGGFRINKIYNTETFYGYALKLNMCTIINNVRYWKANSFSRKTVIQFKLRYSKQTSYTIILKVDLIKLGF